MSVKFALIGGKKNKEILTSRIENEIFKLTGKEKPVVLFCPYASKDTSKATKKFHDLVKNLSCEIIDLTFENVSLFDTYLEKSDVLYISGGISDDLVDYFIKNNLDKILIKYLDSNKIYAGSSAGAMLYCKISMGDKYMYYDNFHNYNYKMVKGLGLLNISICPHYQNEDLICYNDEVRYNNIPSFGIEEDCCLLIDDEKYYIIKEERNMSIYEFIPKEFIMTPLYEGVIYEKIGGFRS